MNNLSDYFRQQINLPPVEFSAVETNWNNRANEVNKFVLGDNDPSLVFLQQHIEIKDRKILEISFGAGRHAVEFTRGGARLSGVEISSKMVHLTKAKLAEQGLSQQIDELIQSPWEAIDLNALNWHEAFDLVFLYQSPALSSVNMLEKCLAATRQWLYFALYCHREDTLLIDLQQTLGMEVKSVAANSAHHFYHLFNLLYLQGYFPNIHFEEKITENAFEPDYILERYASWLWKGPELTQENRYRLLELLKKRTNHQGKVLTRSRDIIGHLLVNKQNKR